MGIARNASYNLIGNVFPLVVTLVTIPVYLKLIGLDRYGVLSLCWVMVGYFGLFELGLGPATAQRIAPMEHHPPKERNEVVWASLMLSTVLGVVGGLLLWGVAQPALGSIKSLQSGLAAEARHALPWLALLLPISTCCGVLSGALQGRQQFLALNLINGAGNVLLSLAPLGAAYFIRPELPVILPSLVVARLATLAAMLVACRSAVPLTRPPRPSIEVMRSLAAFGGWVTAAGILTPLLTSSEKFAIGWLAGAAAVSIYMVPYNLVARLLLIPTSLAGALYPKFATMAADDVDDIEAKGLRSLVGLITPLVIVLMAILLPFFKLWLGDAIAHQSAPIGVILFAGTWFNCCSYIPHARLQGRGRPDLVAKISFFQVLPYFAALYAAFHVAGVVGVATAWSLRAALEMLVFFAMTGQPRRLMSAVAVPALLVVAAAALVLVGGMTEIARLLALLLLMTIALKFTMVEFGSRVMKLARQI